MLVLLPETWAAMRAALAEVKAFTPRRDEAPGSPHSVESHKFYPKLKVEVLVPGADWHAATALATAWGVNAPVMCITGQVPSAMIGRLRGQLHELPDQLATMRTLLKHAAAGRPGCVVKVNQPEGGLVLYAPGTATPEILYPGRV